MLWDQPDNLFSLFLVPVILNINYQSKVIDRAKNNQSVLR